MADPKKDAQNSPKGAEERKVGEQIESNQNADQPDAQEALKTGKLKAEQPRAGGFEEIPESAVIVRQYAKWTDNNGNFHKVPIDGTNAIREPAHEQQELTAEERDRLDQALALKTPRRGDAGKAHVTLKDQEIRNDEVNQDLKEETPVKSAKAQEGPVVGPDDHPDFGKNDGEVSDEFKTPGK